MKTRFTLLIANLFFIFVHLFSQNGFFKLNIEKNKFKLNYVENGVNKYFYLETILPETSADKAFEVLIQNDSLIKIKRKAQNFENSCTVVETFAKKKYGIDWDVEIKGNEVPWSVPIETVLQMDNVDDAKFWTTWADNQTEKNNDNWQNPFVPTPFKNLSFIYGGENQYSRNAFVIPIASIFFNEGNKGLSFTQSLEDTILNLEMHTSEEGKISYQHINHRIQNNNPIHIHHAIIFHEGDWRAGMKWMVDKYPTFFYPKNTLVNEIAGCGAYSSYEGEIDSAKFKKMAFSLNWKASLDFPFMGMFIPPVKNDDEKWVKYKQAGVTVGDGFASIKRLNDYSENFKKHGFYTLSYFNVNEFGNNIVYPYQPQINNANDVWKNANDFLYTKLNSALLRSSKILPDWDNRPIFSNWEDCVAMDPADFVYHYFLLNQAKLHIQKIPASSGICIDRLDWMRYYNGAADDGASFIDGNNARSLIFSWKNIMQKLGPIMHENSKVIFCNPLYRRIDLLEQIDGIYDEFGNVPTSLNLCAQMAFCKPIIAWTKDTSDFKPNPDAYFQHHLFMGAFLTVPFPGNDHTINPNAEIEKYYLDYGSLLQAIKGREWVLFTNAIHVKNEDALANIFKVKENIIIPIINGKDNATMELQLPDYLFKNKIIKVQVLFPGEIKWKNLGKIKYQKIILINTQLQRGCALLKLS